ncbi:hypothetical protein ACFYP4_26390 [Streptomyces sp. NPDC005551]|uniref:hypothetical protein n=1 Tax=unclassified Streptomyces TaxID=2593676 RepID=UPI0033F8113E
MHTRGRSLKFAAVLVMVVLALTGFSSGRGRGGGSHSGGGGGGCSSSSQNHDSSSSSTSGGGSYSSGSTSSGSTSSSDDYDDDDTYGSSSTSGGSTSGGYHRRPNHRSTSSSGSGSKSLEDAKARLVSCATKKTPYATVEVSNPNARKGTFTVAVEFLDENDISVTSGYERVTIPASGKETVRVKVGGSGLVDSVDHCEVDPAARPGS